MIRGIRLTLLHDGHGLELFMLSFVIRDSLILSVKDRR